MLCKLLFIMKQYEHAASLSCSYSVSSLVLNHILHTYLNISYVFNIILNEASSFYIYFSAMSDDMYMI